jgi:superfamily I DNA/RNA helicase
MSEESKGKEFRVFGPPGTGKTTFLAARVKAAAEIRGANRVVVTSFTRAAAQELVGRQLPIPRANVGTLHALCYRALDQPTLAETKLSEWNAECDALLRVSSEDGASLDEPAYDQHFTTVADKLMQEMERLRALMTPKELWPLSVRALYDAWTRWKQQHEYLDFTDLIETGLSEIDEAPGRPSVIMADEAQDFSRLELTLVRKWGARVTDFTLAGDDDQVLYGFKGASAEAFFDPPVPDAQKRVLDQSYRVPRVIQAFSTDWIARVSRREPKVYRPRDHEGTLLFRPDLHYNNPRGVLALVDPMLAAGQTVLLLASCSYMVVPLVTLMREEGYPFQNRWRRKRGDWNPLTTRGVSGADRLAAYLAPQPEYLGDAAHMWTYEDLARWVPVLKADALHRGAKARLEKIPESERGQTPSINELLTFLTEEALSAALDGDLDWWAENLLEIKKGRLMDFTLKALRRWGVREILNPRITPGTIHSVKGGEADVVVLFPDLSAAGAMQWGSSVEGRDAILRQFYVGFTRARDTLVICGPSSSFAVSIQPR